MNTENAKSATAPSEPTALALQMMAQQLEYDAVLGCVRWTPRATGVRSTPGDIAGALRADGYRIIGIAGQKHMASRVAWYLASGRWPSGMVQLADRTKHNLRPDNLWTRDGFIWRCLTGETAAALPREPLPRKVLTDHDILRLDAVRESHNALAEPPCGLRWPIDAYLRALGLAPPAELTAAARLVLALS